MHYFSTNKLFLIPSFDLEEKEKKKIDKFLLFLDYSEVGNIISKYVKNNTIRGGRPNCNYYKLFATILYGFAFDKCTLRELETSIKYDLRYITLMEQTKVDYSTISKFINKVIVPNEKKIFSLLCIQIKKEIGIDFEDAFIDGTKFEANANKYKFVWKPIKFHERISNKANEIIKKYTLYENYKEEKQIRSVTIANCISNLVTQKNKFEEKTYENIYKALVAILEKVLEYEEKERICGPLRNSYYKTDKDATAMALKSDYYSGLGSNMHAAYNTQILVIKGFVFSYYVSQSRSDINDFIPVIDNFHESYDTFPKRICADAIYGTLNNYKYLFNNSIENYVKYQSWEGNVSGTNPDCFFINEDKSITCLNGIIGKEVLIQNRHPKKAGNVFYKIEGCNNCNFKYYCKRFMKELDENFKIFEVNIQFQEYKKQATSNLLSPKGIELRVNRSIQVEGVFGIQKQDYGRERLRRRGIEKVSVETMLNFLGHNIAKLFRFYESGILNKYWIIPNELIAQEFKKTSWKKLSKKGKKTHKKRYG